jgi:undecaprenyl diphosphate synthase
MAFIPPATTPPLPVPRHIAIIMDGNGRWARERGLARMAGHQQGATSVRAITRACAEWGVEFLTVYAFSTENWKRPRAETDALMVLLEHFIEQELPELMRNQIRLRAIGRLEDLPEGCRNTLQKAIDLTASNTSTTLILALSYSGRNDILQATQTLCRMAKSGQLDPETVDESTFQSQLATREYPDPDLLVRTSGEMRLSNFLLWQLSYTELYVTQKLWPDFGKEDLLEAIREFNKRERRFGAV